MPAQTEVPKIVPTLVGRVAFRKSSWSILEHVREAVEDNCLRSPKFSSLARLEQLSPIEAKISPPIIHHTHVCTEIHHDKVSSYLTVFLRWRLMLDQLTLAWKFKNEMFEVVNPL